MCHSLSTAEQAAPCSFKPLQPPRRVISTALPSHNLLLLHLNTSYSSTVRLGLQSQMSLENI